MAQQKSILSQLHEISRGRDHVSTDEFARSVNRASQTVRKNYCLSGECYGIKPVKFGNRLLWPVAEIAELLNGDSQSPVDETAQPPIKVHEILAEGR